MNRNNSGYFIKAKLISAPTLLWIAEILFIAALFYFGIITDQRLVLVLGAVIALHIWWSYSTFKSNHLGIIGAELILNEPFGIWVTLGLKYWRPVKLTDGRWGININNITQIKRSFQWLTIAGGYFWWVLKFINTEGKAYSINYYWYTKEDLTELLKRVLAENPNIQIDNWTKRFIANN